MLKENTLFGERDKVKMAIERLQTFEPPEGYYLAFSGGKDSITILELAKMAKVKFEAHYHVTTIDPPELVKFIKTQNVIWDRPARPFLQELIRRGFPQHHRRWCCEMYKENGGKGRIVVTGIRWAESANRKNRKMVESCNKLAGKNYVHPIIDWSDQEVWQFIRDYNILYCKLYDEGFKRLGCLFCPMGGKHRLIECERYPKYVKAFINAFEKLYQRKKDEGKNSVARWKSGEEMFWWWIRDNKEKYNKDQFILFE